jgi:hypothetical protein
MIEDIFVAASQATRRNIQRAKKKYVSFTNFVNDCKTSTFQASRAVWQQSCVSLRFSKRAASFRRTTTICHHIKFAVSETGQ